MPEFSDGQIIQLIAKSARRINRKLCLFGTDDEITVDSAGEFSNPTDDGALEDLVLMQVDCLIAQRHFMDFLSSDSASAGVVVKDGEQSIDNRTAGTSRASVFSADSPMNPCSELEDSINAEKLKRMMGPGGAGNLIW